MRIFVTIRKVCAISCQHRLDANRRNEMFLLDTAEIKVHHILVSFDETEGV